MGVEVADDSTDRLCLDYGDRDARGFPRVVSLAGSLPLLLGQGVRESGALEHTNSCHRDDDRFHVTQVSARSWLNVDR